MNERVYQERPASKLINLDKSDDPPHGTTPSALGKSNHALPADTVKLLLDDTCAPVNIRYPTNFSLLNEAW